MKLLLYDTEMHSANGYLPRAITQAAANLLGQANVQLCDHGTVVPLAASGAWDGLLAIGGAGADRHLLTALMETPIPRILWTTEDPYERRLLERAEPAFHHVFSNERHCAGASARTTFLPLAAEPTVHGRRLRCQDGDYSYDLTFVGTAWPNRVASLRRLLSQLPRDLRLHLCLPWNRHIPEPSLPGIGALPQLRLDISDLCDIWNRSRVVLTIGREFSNAGSASGQARGSSPPPRVYETALAGGFQVALAGAGMDLKDAYGERIPVAADEGEAAQLIRHYLAEPEQRIQQAHRIHAHTLEHHTYAQRLGAVLERFAALRCQDEATRATAPTAIHLPRRAPAVLHLAHNLVGLGLRRHGGTEAYIDAIARQQSRLKPERSVLALAPKDAIRLALITYREGHAQLQRSLKLCRISRLSASNEAYERALCAVISEHGIGVVHVHHLIGLPLSLPILAKALGCRVVVTLHDFHLICHRYTLLKPDGRFCQIHEQPDDGLSCRVCLQASGMQGDERNRRLAISRRCVAAADVVLASTQASAQIMAGVYPEIADRIQVLEMLTPGLEQLDAARIPRHRRDRRTPLQVGVIGNAMPHKGLATLVQVIRAAHNLPIDLHILGATPELDEALTQAGLTPTTRPIQSYGGSYERDTLIQTLQRLDVALFLSTWPETYHIGLGEAMRLGVVPVATAIGAHQDRIEPGRTGIMVEPGNPEAVLRALVDLDADRDRLARLANAAAASPLLDTEQHVWRLEQVYGALQPWRGSNLPTHPLELDPQLNLEALGLRLAQNRWNEPGVRWDAPP